MSYLTINDLLAREADFREQAKVQLKFVVLFGLFAVAVLLLSKLAPPVDPGQWFILICLWGIWIHRLLIWHALRIEASVLRRLIHDLGEYGLERNLSQALAAATDPGQTSI